MICRKCHFKLKKTLCVFMMSFYFMFVLFLWDTLFKGDIQTVNAKTQPLNLVATLKSAETQRPPDLKSCFGNVPIPTSNALVMIGVSMFPVKRLGKRKGGENISNVVNQRELDEYFTFKRGFLRAKCVRNTERELKRILSSSKKSLAAQMLNSLADASNSSLVNNSVQGFTLGIVRIDYANVYWTFLELFGVYVTSLEMKTRSQDTTVLLMDAHPASPLDGIWNILFKKVIRVGWLDTPVNFSSLAIVPELKFNPIVKKATPIQHMQHFTSDVFTSVGVSPDRKINCQKLKVTLILRKNYVAHPRNIKGKISRQLANPEETIKHLQSMPNLEVQAVALETLSIADQIRLITNATDILIGAHGAGLAHTLFQVRGAGMIELFPRAYWKNKNTHMELLCKKSGKYYDSWYSGEQKKQTLYVPPSALTKLISKMRDTICKSG